MSTNKKDDLIRIEPDQLWERCFSVAPLVIVGSREADGSIDLAPKHMAMPIGHRRTLFGFVCTPRHRTYVNIRRTGQFTVSYPQPDQVLITALTAEPRCEDKKHSLTALKTVPAEVVDGVLIRDSNQMLECELDRFIDDLDGFSLIIGRVVAARARAETLRDVEMGDQAVIEASPLLAYLEPGRFARISESAAFPFPKGFRR